MRRNPPAISGRRIGEPQVSPDPMTSDPKGSGASASADSGDTTKSFHLWMDAFRTLAAVMVLISHTRDITVQDYSGVAWTMPIYFATSLGHTGVVLFFVMSGYWISASVVSRVGGQSFWPEYLIARLSRLWVVLIPALILGGLMDFYGDQILHLPAYQNAIGSHSLTGNVADRLGLPTFLANALFVQTILAPTWGSNGPLWSLAAEFWYYLMFPVLVILFGRKRRMAWFTLLACIAVSIANLQLFLGFFVWLLGYTLQIIFRNHGHGERTVSRSLVLVLATALLIGAFAVNSAIKNCVPDIAMGVVFSLFLIALRGSAAPFPRWLEWVALYGRKSSFSLYAIHFPIVILLGGLAVGGARYPAGGHGFLVMTAICVVCFVAAFGFSLLTEWNTDQVRRKMTRAYARVTNRV